MAFGGLRCLRDVRLDLDGLTVLIGENGSGKSSVLEGLQLLRRIPRPDFRERFQDEHAGVDPLMGSAGGTLRLAATIVGSKYTFEYAATISGQADGRWWFQDETLDAKKAASEERISRARDVRGFVEGATNSQGLQPTMSALATEFGGFSPCGELIDALGGIDVQLPFRVTAAWAGRSVSDVSPMRAAQPIGTADRLRLFGSNIASAYQALKNQGRESWERTLDYVRLGLGDRVDDVAVEVFGQGLASLTLIMRSGVRVGAGALSDGMLSYLGFVALYRLSPGRSLLAFDEPELHLHPELLLRVLGLFEAEAAEHPVIVATHSDRLLDALEDPARSVVVCELDANDSARLRRLDGATLTTWLERFRGVGDVRANGELALVLGDEEAGQGLQ